MWFPYLPDTDYYQQLIESRWAELEPDIQLIRKDWDCYSDGEPEGIDVIIYDAVMQDGNPSTCSGEYYEKIIYN